MNKPKISIIAAVGKNRELGKDNNLLWRIPEDLKRFKTLTLGHPIIMGRKTFDSIGKPLPERISIVITRDKAWKHEGVNVAHSLEEAIEIACQKEKGEIFIIGGSQIYEQALPVTERLYLTLVEANKDSDSFFPNWIEFKKTISEEKRIDQKTGLQYTWVTLERDN